MVDVFCNFVKALVHKPGIINLFLRDYISVAPGLQILKLCFECLLVYFLLIVGNILLEFCSDLLFSETKIGFLILPVDRKDLEIGGVFIISYRSCAHDDQFVPITVLKLDQIPVEPL